MKQNIPIFALAISLFGTLTNFMTEAKSLFGALAALASLIASCYAIAIARANLRKAKLEEKKAEDSQQSHHIVPAILLLATLTVSGCSHFAGRAARTTAALQTNTAQIQEESRALTSAIVDTLAVAPTNKETQLAQKFAVADQQLEGLPAKRIDVAPILAGDPSATAALQTRLRHAEELQADNNRLTAELRETESRLVEMGRKYEAEKNRSIFRRIIAAITGTVGIGGLIAAAILCPALIPLGTRFLAWIVAKVPHLAGALGVVGKDAFDAVVKGIGLARAELKKKNSPDLASIDSNLAAETDADHKDLIAMRRAALNV